MIPSSLSDESQQDDGSDADLTLVIADWCPFTSGASTFWKNVAKETGKTLRIIELDSPQGDRFMRKHGVAGVPCLITDSGEKQYGLNLTIAEASVFVKDLSPSNA